MRGAIGGRRRDCVGKGESGLVFLLPSVLRGTSEGFILSVVRPRAAVEIDVVPGIEGCPDKTVFVPTDRFLWRRLLGREECSCGVQPSRGQVNSGSQEA